MDDLPLPLPLPLTLDDPDTPTDHWPVPGRPPVTLAVAWPGEQPPKQPALVEWLRAVLADDFPHRGSPGGGCQIEPLEQDEAASGAGDSGAIMVRLPGSNVPILFWVEPIDPQPQDVIDEIGLHRCRHLIIVQTLLDPAHPHAGLAFLMRRFTAPTDEIMPVFDADSDRWLSAIAVEERFVLPQAEPTGDMLFSVLVIPSPQGQMYWLRTAGMNRLGRPELELFEIPRPLVDAAAHMLMTVGEAMLEAALPPAGEAMELGDGVGVTLQQPEDVLAYLDEQTIDQRAALLSRQPGEAVSAVLCGAEPEGTYRSIWRAPLAALERLAQGAPMYIEPAVARRHEQLARDTWPHVAGAFAQHARDGGVIDDETMSIQVRIAFAQPSEDADCSGTPVAVEHLWFEVESVENEMIHGLAMEQSRIHADVQQGTAHAVSAAEISGWRVRTPHGEFQPPEVRSLEISLRALRGTISRSEGSMS